MMYTTDTKRGRPKTGRNPTLTITLSKDLLKQVNKIAGDNFERRADTIRRLLANGIRLEKDWP